MQGFKPSRNIDVSNEMMY